MPVAVRSRSMYRPAPYVSVPDVASVKGTNSRWPFDPSSSNAVNCSGWPSSENWSRPSMRTWRRCPVEVSISTIGVGVAKSSEAGTRYAGSGG